MNKRADNLLILGLVAIMVIAGLAYFLGRTTAQLDAGDTVPAAQTRSEDTRDSDGLDSDGLGSDGLNSDGLGSDEGQAQAGDDYASVVNSTVVSGYQDRTISIWSLPPEALDTIDAIATGGPYAYSKDGSTFQNREGLLPDHDIGYYQEFTVDTPGSSDRGARRIVTGADGEMFYTADHYDSFEQILAGAP